jgi:hypothetical protein
MAQLEPGLLHRRWVHAHEEDSGGGMVFRPEGLPLPPSRGRRSLDLRSDGTLSERGPGPDDRLEEHGGTWRLDGRELVLVHGGGIEERLRVRSLDAERLVVEQQ